MGIKNIFHSVLFKGTGGSPLRYSPDSQGLGLELPESVLKQARKGQGHELVLYQYIIFQMLLEEGLGEEIKNGVHLPSENAVRLDSETRNILNLPEPWPGSFRLQTHSISAKTDFRLQLELLTPNSEVIRNYSLHGPILSVSEEEIYLPEVYQWEALSAINDHHQLAEYGRDEFQNLLAVHRLVQARESGLDIDLSAFREKNTLKPEHVGLAIQEENDGSLTLIPSFGGDISPDAIKERLGQIHSESRSKSLRVGQTIVLLDEKRLKAAREIISNHKIPASLKETFFNNPSAFLDASLVDLDVGFSFRVKGAGPFKHGYLGETDESGINWFYQEDNISVTQGSESASPEELENIIPDSESLERFHLHFEDALATGASILEFDKKSVDISDSDEVRRVIRTLEQKFQDLNGSVQEEEISSEEKENNKDEAPKVLDIHLQDEEISVGQEGGTAPSKKLLSDISVDFDFYKRKPYPHQEEGIRWLFALATNEEKITEPKLLRTGALLADDMGLGKTYMALVGIREYLLQASDIAKDRPVLIVAPLSLLEIWHREIEDTYKNSPFNRIVILHVNADLPEFRLPRKNVEIRHQHLSDNETSGETPVKYARFSLKVGKQFGTERLDQPGRLILTTYQTLRDYQFSLCSIDWTMAVFDEAQNIKNPNALQTRAAKAVKSEFKLLLTGTPVENHLGDFWCLIDTVQTGFLGHYQKFRQEYIKPILKASAAEAEQIRTRTGQKLRDRVGGFMLRRIKEDHLKGLPIKKIFIGHDLSAGDCYEFDSRLSKRMQGMQRERYDAVINSTRDALHEKSGNSAVLKGLHQLKDVSLHPVLLEKGIPNLPQSPQDVRRILLQSGKLETVLEILEKICGRREKVIIFVINKRLQRFLSAGLQKLFNVKVNIINGDTKAISGNKNCQTRQSIIDEFQENSGFGILIMSPIAAGVGLTITSANNIIHLERHWNPAKEAQATDRVYRIGQKKDVNVFVPILSHPEMDSFDVNLNKLLMSKSALKDAVVTPETVQFHDFVNMGMFGQRAKAISRVKIEDIQSFSGEIFEALVAEIYAREENEVFLTPYSGDRGCDVVVLSKRNGNKLVQCKKTQNIRQLDGDSPIREIYASKPFYETKFNKKFKILEVYTNAKKYSRKGIHAAKNYNTILKRQRDLIEALKRYEITFEHILKRNNNRILL